MTDARRQAILDEIILATAPPRRKAYQFSRREYQEHRGITQAEARHALGKLVKSGQLQKERVLLDGKWADVFWRVQDEPEATRD